MMAARAKARADQGGQLAAGGTANALTVTSNQVLSAAHLANGQRLLVYAPSTNTSSTVTFAPDGLTPAPIRRADGSVLAEGDIRAGMSLDLVYISGTSDWRAINIAPTGAGQASFFAYKSVAQTIGSTANTSVTFDSTNFNIAGLFAGSAWTPPRGLVHVSANLIITNSSGLSATFQLKIIRDALTLQTAFLPVITPAQVASLDLSVLDQPGGANVYFVQCQGSAAPYTVNANFFGYMI
jgi:hypothetical protein